MTDKRASNLFDEKWHSMPLESVYEELATDTGGLSEEKAERRLLKYGKNSLPAKKPPTIFSILLHQIMNPLIFILIAAAAASIAIGEITDAVFILIVIILNSTLGAYQEYNAEKSAASLQNLLKIITRVRRDNRDFEISAEEVVPGDIISLESGNKVPADMRLIEAANLTVDESFLTGESVAAEKKTGRLMKDAAVSERTNMAFAGSSVTSGRGLGVVTGTGMQTQVGKIAENVTQSESAKPPLVMRMERFTKQISFLVLALAGILALVLKNQGVENTEIFFFVVALAVSAIPEGLPVALTVALSIATSRMSKRQVIVRKLTAVESLGSCTVIASDKTGTLTVNQQTVRLIELPDGKTFSLTGEGYNGEGEIFNSDKSQPGDDDIKKVRHILKLASLTNEGKLEKSDDQWDFHGDAMDVAFLAAACKADLKTEEIRKEFPLLGSIPYESERKFSAAFYDKNKTAQIAAKGAVETILQLCNTMASGDGAAEIDREEIEKRALEMAEQGYRVLAVAGGEFPGFEVKETYENEDIPGLTFYGLTGFIDPLRPEAKAAVDKCSEAGIQVLMITGDHHATAAAISRELGISRAGEEVVTGKMLEDAGSPDSPAYEKLVLSTHVFARVSPSQKLEIVDVLINCGEFVAVTGDGVNDAPAMQRANIGVAMGSGTDVAKEVSSMIVVDDNFSSIVSGVEEGRFAYDNVRKVIYLLISTGTAEVTLFVASIMAGLPLPLLAVQLLWLNLVTNGIQDVALAFEGGEPGAMKKKPRKTDERIFNGQMIQQTLVSGFGMGLIAFAFWHYLINIELMDETHARNIILLLMVFMQNVHAFSCRSETVSAFKVPLKRNVILVFGVLAAQGIHILSMQIPFMQNVLRIEPITPFEWVEVLILAIPLLIIMEIFKFIKNRVSSDETVNV